MAFYTVPSNIKNSILAFVKNIVSKTYYRAFEVILNPCCSLTGTAEVSYNDDNTYAIVITTNESIGFLGKGVATLLIDGSLFTGVVTEPNTIYVETATLSAGSYDIDVTVLLPTNTDANAGVFKSFTIADVTFASCV